MHVGEDSERAAPARPNVEYPAARLNERQKGRHRAFHGCIDRRRAIGTQLRREESGPQDTHTPRPFEAQPQLAHTNYSSTPGHFPNTLTWVHIVATKWTFYVQAF